MSPHVHVQEIHQTSQKSDRIVSSGSFVRDRFEGTELQAGRQLVDGIRDELHSDKSIGTEDEGKGQEIFGRHNCNLCE